MIQDPQASMVVEKLEAAPGVHHTSQPQFLPRRKTPPRFVARPVGAAGNPLRQRPASGAPVDNQKDNLTDQQSLMRRMRLLARGAPAETASGEVISSEIRTEQIPAKDNIASHFASLLGHPPQEQPSEVAGPSPKSQVQTFKAKIPVRPRKLVPRPAAVKVSMSCRPL